MTDERRLIKAYRPRLTIPTDTLSNNPGYALYCLPRDGADMLNRVLEYLTREVTFINEVVTDTHYYGPTEVELERARDLAGEIGAALVSECDISEITTELETLNITMDLMKDCVCALQAQLSQSGSSALTDVGRDYAPTIADQIIVESEPVPPIENDICNLANVQVGFAYQWIQEQLLPFLTAAVDSTTIAIGATSAFAVASGGLGLPVAMATSILSVVVNMLIDTSVEDLINWMFANHGYLVCHLYTGMRDGGYALAAARAGDHIDNANLPLGDRMSLKLLLTSEFYLQGIKQQYEAGHLNLTDYLISPCITCDEFEYQYWYDGANCPNGNLTGTYCDQGYPTVDVANQVETLEPYVVVEPGAITYHMTLKASASGGIGRTIAVIMRSTAGAVPLDTQTFYVPSTAQGALFEFDWGAYAGASVYWTFQNQGAASVNLHWVGVNVIHP